MSLDDEPTPSTPGRILLFVLASVLALVLPLVVMRQVFGTGDPASSGPPVPTAAPAPLGVGAASAFTASSTRSPALAGQAAATGAVSAAGAATLAQAAETCRLANLRQQAPLSAAEVSLAQFDKHIDAMKLLVAGKISLSVVTTFWDQTRVKAAQNVGAFRRADKELTGNTPTCPDLDPAIADAAPY